MKRTFSLFDRRDASVATWLLFGLVVLACGGDDASTATTDGGGALDGTVPPGQHDGGASDATVGPTDSGNGTPADGATSFDAGPVPLACNGSIASASTPVTGLPASPAVTLPSGFTIETVAKIASAREIVALPNGDLLVATYGTDVVLVPNAEGTGSAGAPVTFATINESPVQGVTFDPSSCTVYVASHSAIYAMAYVDAQTSATPGNPIAHVRTGAIAPNSDGDVHVSSSVALAGGTLYAGVGSSCNACTEVDPTRATVQAMHPDGSSMTTRATRFRNAIALTTNPATGTLWAGGAGQDAIAAGHPYEFFDAVTLHAGTADYGWPDCEENHIAYKAGADCSGQAVPLIEFPAYSTLIGATFYPPSQNGSHAFPASYRGGLFITAHGSWHKNGSAYFSPPRVAFVAMNGDAPKVAVDWNDPTKQWTDFIGGYQLADGVKRIGRPTGIAVGAQGSLFVADDQNGAVYRIRPN